MVTVFPKTVQTAVVLETKLTGNPELAAALIVNGVAPRVWFPIAGNEMLCSAWLTEKLWVTGGAAKYSAFPTWLAVIEQMPVETRITVFPETVQTAFVPEAKLTGSPELAVALTLNGAVPNPWFGRNRNVIV
jgi:hypothetical protein